MSWGTLLAYGVGLFLVYLFLRILVVPARVISQLVLNGLLGAVVLWIGNLIGAPFGVTVGVNPITALIAGSLGLPGVVVLFVLAYFVVA